DDVKKLRDTRGKELEAEAKKSKSKEAQDALKKFQDEVAALDRRSKFLPEIGQRLLHAEVRHVPPAKETIARVTNPLGTQESRKFRLLGETKSLDVPKDQDPRTLVVAWMRRPDNPFFAKAIVNRVWAHYFGRGIIDPPDHLSPLNPPSHPELLADLSADFIKHGYDLKHLHRVILQSRTYQQSAQTNATNRHDSTNYASSYLRRLPAEVLVDALNHATGGTETFPPELHLPPGSKAMEVAGGTGNERARATLQYPFHIFGRPMRSPDVQCDCERDTKPTIIQTLYLA